MGHTIQLILDVIFLLSLILFDLLYMLFPPYKLSRGSVFLLPVAFYVSALVVADRVDSYCFRSRTPSCTEHGKRAKKATTAGFEPARAKPNRFLVCLLDHSDKLS